jgi:NAD(P)-dependent dehydrogenase (short-subunit alcohol dehydrogenase family)
MSQTATPDSAPTVLITGCSSGIGRATAERFLTEGWQVYATARRLDDLSELADSGAAVAELDVTDRASIDRVVERMLAETDRIDCVVNNAGYGEIGPLEDVSAERIHSQFDVNVYGPIRVIQAVLPAMRARESGRIINVSAGFGRIAAPGTSVYAASKFALEGLSDALRTEFAPFGIRVSVVGPGPVETGFADRSEAASAGVDRSPDYGWVYEAFDRMSSEERFDGFAGRLMLESPEHLASVIYEVATAKRPRARYAVGTVARGIELALRLPTGIRHRLISRMMRPTARDDTGDRESHIGQVDAPTRPP